jgi:two-component system, OmpR family, alkaline phosphatase synthesis response regulator PhoP
MSSKVLIVEDEPGLVLTLRHRLKSENYRVEAVSDGNSALTMACTRDFDLIILDVMLPERGGFEVCRELRLQGVKVPILMLTARGQVEDRVSGLKIGADDYLTKPFDMAELLARVEALLRRAGRGSPAGPAVYRFGDIEVNFRRAEVLKTGIPIVLTAREYKLLRYMIRNRGVALSRNELLDEVWGYNAMPSTRTVDVHVAGLRQKLEPCPRSPRYIETLHGLGYRFVG